MQHCSCYLFLEARSCSLFINHQNVFLNGFYFPMSWCNVPYIFIKSNLLAFLSVRSPRYCYIIKSLCQTVNKTTASFIENVLKLTKRKKMVTDKSVLSERESSFMFQPKLQNLLQIYKGLEKALSVVYSVQITL